MTRIRVVGLTLALAVLLAACSSGEPCGPVAPSRMPDGSAPEAYATSVSGGFPIAIWRAGDSFVIQRAIPASAPGEPACPDGEVPGPAEDCLEVGGIVVRGLPALIAPAGDDGTQWLLAWTSGGCRYETSFGPLERPEAEAYAAGY